LIVPSTKKRKGASKAPPRPVSLSRALYTKYTEIASQGRCINALIEFAFDIGSKGFGFEVDDLAAVAKVLLHKIRTIVDVAAKF
jgi:hypothetical protein